MPPVRLHGVRSSWKRHLPILAKLLIGLPVLSYFFWNVTSITFMIQSRMSSLRHEATRGDSDEVLDNHSNDASNDTDGTRWLHPSAYERDDGCDFSAAVARFKPEELELNCTNINQLEEGEFLGKGFWREVFKSKWNGRDVAVKRVKKHLLNRADIIPRHIEECASIFSIRNEPNIVGLVGWCKTTVVVEYIPYQLDTLLFESEEPVSVHRALELARDAARGVAQLHNAPGGPFVHTDLQARQFLIDANGTLRLNDFNRVKYSGPRLVNGTPTNENCTFRTSVAKGKWRSPEEYSRRKLDEKLDIYSLSIVLWTLRAREKPFVYWERETVYEKVPYGARPPVEAMSDYPLEMQELIVRGWDNDPKNRPTASEMAEEIDRILKRFENNQ
ncbi:tkl protein kinase [Plasmopara halstedii]|uniref:Tkl protein kinase n=1 Tax=Plasmopara halstedii TaxID=4781 RepID=A0A0P1B362_PLAHL|nr:tkl protein kinase [Plasmopara halstedii]CEG48098.1 tkl protein kinase [Plasmopara halstedii]|eukprot:XP_024584467.1 tkl protein kinase [Plasmopara halstedii]